MINYSKFHRGKLYISHHLSKVKFTLCNLNLQKSVFKHAERLELLLF